MRNKKMAFLSCAIVAATGLLAAPAVMATNYPSTCNASPTIDVVPDAHGVPTPCLVKYDPLTPTIQPRCALPNEAADYTGVRYKNARGPSFNHVAILTTSNNEVVVPSGTQVIGDCKGDPLTSLGYRSCHENAVKINGVPAAATFWVVVKGRKQPLAMTIATKKDSTIKCFPITGLGITASSSQLIQQVQRVTSQDGCAVDFVTDALTGEPISVKLTPESVLNNCVSPSLGTDGEILPLDAGEFEIKREGDPRNYGKWKFGEGYVRSGTHSCTTRIIGGRVYTWGVDCPE